MFSKYSVRRCVAAALLAGGLSSVAHAAILITGTRVIYPMQEREVTVRVTNNGPKPSVVQSWIDDGDAKQTPDNAVVPFVLTPPIARVDPSRSQSLRIVSTQTNLPTDRESLYWLNVLEVPADAKAAPVSPQELRIVFRSRIKLIVRPKDLPGNPDAAGEKLTWRVVPGAAGKGWAIECNNPSAYYVSFNRIDLAQDGKTTEAGGGMVAPRATERFPLPDLKAAPAGGNAEVRYSTINDYGGFVDHKSPLQPQ